MKFALGFWVCCFLVIVDGMKGIRLWENLIKGEFNRCPMLP